MERTSGGVVMTPPRGAGFPAGRRAGAGMTPGRLAAFARNMSALLGQRVFSVGTTDYYWEDVVLAAVLRGDWRELAETVRWGLACVERAERTGRPSGADDAAAAAEFRYARGLLRAADTHAWLARRDVTPRAWMAYLRRARLRALPWGPADGSSPHAPMSDDAVAGAIMCEGACSGMLLRLARRLAARAAVSDAYPDDAADDEADALLARLHGALATATLPPLDPTRCEERAPFVVRAELALRRARGRVVTPRAVGAQVAARRLEWTVLDHRALGFPDAAEAAEAALCAREDGESLRQVAAASGRPLLETSAFADETDRGARDLVVDSFVAATFRFGEVVVREAERPDALYVVVSGVCRSVARDDGGGEIALATLTAGDSFGEAWTLGRAEHPATVRASGEVEVLRLDRSVVAALLRRPDVRDVLEREAARRGVRDFVRAHTPLGRLRGAALAAVADALRPVSAAAGEVVVGPGEDPAPLLVVVEGRLRAFPDDAGGHRAVAYLRRGDVFGERAVASGRVAEIGLEAVEASALLRLDGDVCRRLCGEHDTLRELLEERAARQDVGPTARIPLDFARALPPAAPEIPPDEPSADAPAASRCRRRGSRSCSAGRR